MKLSETIEKLEALKKEHGDIDIECWSYDGQTAPSSITGFRITEYADGDWRYVKKLKLSPNGNKIPDGCERIFVTTGPVKKRILINDE